MDKKKCVPFVSQYTDCTDENMCTGCTKCTCTAEGQWSCDSVQECDEEDQNESDINDRYIENALQTIETEIKNKRIKEAKATNTPLVPRPKKNFEKDLLLDPTHKLYDPMEEIMQFMTRHKRSVKSDGKYAKIKELGKINNTVKFFGVTDEINEDTLKNSNISGTLEAQKVDTINLSTISRRTGTLDPTNKSLQIEFNESNLSNHITDNKIDTRGHNEDRFDFGREKIRNILSNYSQEAKDKELSKLVVNELKKNSEVIGDNTAPVISNITFTPENDSFSAVTFIAGNLLSKLWNIEKDAGETSIETEVIKHEKIANLLELFKEPLNMKQEAFLKNALAQLSEAIDKPKEKKNISICENIQEATKLLDDTSSSSEFYDIDQNKKPKGCKNAQKKRYDTKTQSVDSISKINNILMLIQKFDGIQKKISDLKDSQTDSEKKRDKAISPKIVMNGVLTSDEKKSFNQFESLLAKITKMLYPKNRAVNLNKQVTNDDIKNKLKNMYGIDLGNLTVTSKDKLIFDYLNHIEANPECLLKSHRKPKTKSLANVEGNILLNLSEFFKIKSFSDLIKLLNPKDQPSVHNPVVTSEKPIETTMSIETISNISNIKEPMKLESTKDKLKVHLKTILEDLIEIQNTRGVNNDDIRLADALPCIYNILNADKKIFNNKSKNTDPSDKIGVIFDKLKNDLKFAHSRRSNIIVGPRPKSAVVWERTIKSLNDKSKSNTRRNFDLITSKPFEEIKKAIDKIESFGSNTYKIFALLLEVPAGEKLVLLQTLESDVKKYIRILEDIKQFINNHNDISSAQQSELIEFVDNVATNIILNGKVLNNVNSPKKKKHFGNEVNASRNVFKTKLKKNQALRMSEGVISGGDTMVSRDLIINQLIRNRVHLYMRLKEAKEMDLDSDMNYKIAQRILILLESGNYKLARELYKIFITQTQNIYERRSNNRYTDSSLQKLKDHLATISIQQKQPIIQFEEPMTEENPLKWISQDHLIKQLLNIKNMN